MQWTENITQCTANSLMSLSVDITVTIITFTLDTVNMDPGGNINNLLNGRRSKIRALNSLKYQPIFHIFGRRWATTHTSERPYILTHFYPDEKNVRVFLYGTNRQRNLYHETERETERERERAMTPAACTRQQNSLNDSTMLNKYPRCGHINTVSRRRWQSWPAMFG